MQVLFLHFDSPVKCQDSKFGKVEALHLRVSKYYPFLEIVVLFGPWYLEANQMHGFGLYLEFLGSDSFPTSMTDALQTDHWNS